uniref:Calcium/calmodulin-dependent 3',5'-cyclic nucleotide phosphodiesterase 1A-like n=1 Tax=Sinocyclocheilus anshuiensis TaxID=1608454 RepID=A0A671NDT3_9TELE
MDRYLFVCVYCRLSRKNSHNNENFIIITHPHVIPNPYDFLSEPLFSMKIDGDLGLRCLVKQLDKGEVNVVDLRKNIEYAASVLEAVYIDETRRLLDTEDELSDIQADSVPMEVRDWLASTFTRKMGVVRRRPEEKPRFRSIVHAVQAGIFVERMYRRTSNMAGLTYPPSVITALKDVDKWSFDVFTLQEASSEHALKFLVYELLTRYDLISRFRSDSMIRSC